MPNVHVGYINEVEKTSSMPARNDQSAPPGPAGTNNIAAWSPTFLRWFPGWHIVLVNISTGTNNRASRIYQNRTGRFWYSVLLLVVLILLPEHPLSGAISHDLIDVPCARYQGLPRFGCM